MLPVQPLSPQSSLSGGASGADAEADAARRTELLKGCRTVLGELTGLDFPRSEVSRYFKAAVKPPAKHAGFDVARASASLDALLAPGADGSSVQDTESLVVLNVSAVWGVGLGLMALRAWLRHAKWFVGVQLLCQQHGKRARSSAGTHSGSALEIHTLRICKGLECCLTAKVNPAGPLVWF